MENIFMKTYAEKTALVTKPNSCDVFLKSEEKKGLKFKKGKDNSIKLILYT